MMNRRLLQTMLCLLIFVCTACQQEAEQATGKLTSINPLSYTSVCYTAARDTVVVATYSGRIARRIKNDPAEHVIARIEDEIYALAYAGSRHEIIAATLNSGILVLDAGTGQILRKLPLNNSWAIRIGLSPDEHILFTTNLKGENFIWDVANDYRAIDLDESLQGKSLRFADASGNLYFSSRDSLILWNQAGGKKAGQLFTRGNRLADVDANGDLLLLNHNECLLFTRASDSITYAVSHPNWLYLDQEGEKIGEIPLSMQLTRAKFAGTRIYTAGIDRSIRVWETSSGKLLDSWTGHPATISDLQVSGDHRQMVSVDLKGRVFFWDLD